MKNLPKEYESIIEKLIPDISILDIVDMQEELQAKYNRLMKYNEGSNNEEDQALVSNQGFKQFKGKCLKCDTKQPIVVPAKNFMETATTAVNQDTELLNAERRKEKNGMG